MRKLKMAKRKFGFIIYFLIRAENINLIYLTLIISFNVCGVFELPQVAFLAHVDYRLPRHVLWLTTEQV